MGDGRVQEEIRFTVCPEMLISILVSEMMHPHECIFLIGCEQYMSYEGYADTFKAKEPNTDKTRKYALSGVLYGRRTDCLVCA